MASQYEALEATQASTCAHVCSVMVVGSNPLSSANRPGFSSDKNPRNTGRLASRGLVCEPNSGRSPVVCAQYRRPVSARKIRFPGCTMEAVGPQQRKRNIASASSRRQRGSAEFDSNLNRLPQSHCAPLLGPENWQVGQALDAEPAWKATLECSFRQDGGDERERLFDSERRTAAIASCPGSRQI